MALNGNTERGRGLLGNRAPGPVDGSFVASRGLRKGFVTSARWDSASAGSNIVLSNGDRTATASAGSAYSTNKLRLNTSVASGKWILPMVLNVMPPAVQFYFGLGLLDSTAYTNNLGSGSAGIGRNTAGLLYTGAGFSNVGDFAPVSGASTAGLPLEAGMPIDLLADFDNRRAWIAAWGQPFGNPTDINFGAFTWSSALTLYPCVHIYHDGSTAAQVTIQTGLLYDYPSLGFYNVL